MAPTPKLFAPKMIPRHHGTNLKIWKQSLLPFSSYKRTNKHTYCLLYTDVKLDGRTACNSIKNLQVCVLVD